MTRPLKWLSWAALALISVVTLLIGCVWWTVNTQSGTRWLAGVAGDALKQQLVIESVTGTIAGPLSLRGLRYTDPESGLQFSAREIDVDLALRALLHKVVQIDSARLDGVLVKLADNPPEDDEPFSLEPPVDVVLRQLSAGSVEVTRSGDSLVVITRADAAASWTAAGIAVEKLDVRSPQGEVHFNGRVQQREIFVGSGAGRFRWRAGELDYAGSLHAQTSNDRAIVTIQLTSPLTAQVDATIDQAPTFAWTMKLDVPDFDPRKSLLPDSSLQSLAASLNGNGTLERADLAGTVTLNGQMLTLDSLQVARNDLGVDIASTIQLGKGFLHANGKLFTDAPPTRAEFALDWSDLDIPEQWAGQVLHTRGRIDFNGSSEGYAAKGSLSLGPDRRIANIELDVKGTGEAVQLQRFDIVQRDGRLASTGTLTLKPVLGWDVNATAEKFDPGAFASAWNGDLSFGLKSAGEMTDNGPNGTLVVNRLHGRLRNRDLSGTVDLSLQPGMLLAGVLDLRSGGSQIHLDGRREGLSTGKGGREQKNAKLHAVATAQIATLADWIPDASGTLDARVTVTGAWPQLTIVGDASGSSLQLAQMTADSLQLNFDVTNPRRPAGSMKLDVTNIAAAGFHFETLNVTADGDAAQHNVAVRAGGSPLGTDFAVQGSLRGNEWTGSVPRLVLDLKNVARLSLQAPAQIHYASNAVSVSQSCFADRDIHLCLEGNLAPDGAMNANYSLQHVPLALANALAPGVLPIEIDGTLEGDGRIARSAQGTLSGQAHLRSPAGKLSQPAGPGNEPAQSLLTYENLDVLADLNGDAAALKVDAKLDQHGSLTGNLAVSGLGTSSTGLSGQAQATLPSLAVVEAFAPQLAKVQGRLELHARIAGTFDQPALSGSLKLTQLAAEIPELGIKLANGQFEATPRDDGEFALNGAIESGNGKVTFGGVASQTGTLQIDIHGERFLAADIPGAKVLITPDLDFARTAQQMSLTGKVVVPEASINLQKMPRGARAQRASDDVVVIEAQSQEDAAVRSMPLLAEVTVILGDKVDLTGFGVEAKISGQLIVRERPGEPTTGSGEIRVAGTYKAYGQDLTVQQGQLLFAGTPLDNPRLNIVAVRTVDEVNAGVRVTGSAQNPQLTVFSDPPMGQTNALSYLIAGKPLEEVGSGNSEGDAIGAAARSLSTAAGGLLAKKIGSRLGVDEVGITDSETLGGSAFTIGHYLSPRLYMSYGVGLFQPGEVVTLRYKLREDIAIQAERGPKDNRAGVEYRLEK